MCVTGGGCEGGGCEDGGCGGGGCGGGGSASFDILRLSNAKNYYTFAILKTGIKKFP